MQREAATTFTSQISREDQKSLSQTPFCAEYFKFSCETRRCCFWRRSSRSAQPTRQRTARSASSGARSARVRRADEPPLRLCNRAFRRLARERAAGREGAVPASRASSPRARSGARRAGRTRRAPCRSPRRGTAANHAQARRTFFHERFTWPSCTSAPLFSCAALAHRVQGCQPSSMHAACALSPICALPSRAFARGENAAVSAVVLTAREARESRSRAQPGMVF